MTRQSKRSDLIAQLRAFPERLESGIAPLTAAQTAMPCGPGEWTVHEIVHHLADAHMNGCIRMKLVLTENKPILKPYDQDAWVKLADMQTPIDSSLAILRGLHHRWAALLHDLPESSWERAGVHLDSGLMRLDDLLAAYIDHGEQHLAQIQRLKQAQGVQG